MVQSGPDPIFGKLLDQLSPADVEIVARAIAQGIAEGRRSGLEIAQVRYAG